jgi:DNA-directed RNA polymerase subunit omega
MTAGDKMSQSKIVCRKVLTLFELVMLAAKRARQLLKGAKPLIESDNREVVIALREIAAGKVRRATPKT